MQEKVEQQNEKGLPENDTVNTESKSFPAVLFAI